MCKRYVPLLPETTTKAVIPELPQASAFQLKLSYTKSPTGPYLVHQRLFQCNIQMLFGKWKEICNQLIKLFLNIIKV